MCSSEIEIELRNEIKKHIAKDDLKTITLKMLRKKVSNNYFIICMCVCMYVFFRLEIYVDFLQLLFRYPVRSEKRWIRKNSKNFFSVS